MPTRQNPGVRRSRRQQGIAHNLLELSDTANQKPASKIAPTRKGNSTSRNSVEEEEAYVPPVQAEESSEEELEVDVVDSKPHPSKNYTKPVLYEKWKKATKELSEKKNLCTDIQKQLGTLNRRIAFLQKEVERTETLENKVTTLQNKLAAANEKASALNTNSKSSNAVTKKMLDSMKATYDNLSSQKDFEHKSALCDLDYKFKEIELKYVAKEEENKKLKDEIATLKKTTTSINELKVASLKSEIQIRTMEDKSHLK